DAGEPVLAPVIGARASLIVAEIVPGIPVSAVVLADGAPLAFAEIRPPLPPRHSRFPGFVQALRLHVGRFDRHPLRIRERGGGNPPAAGGGTAHTDLRPERQAVRSGLASDGPKGQRRREGCPDRIGLYARLISRRIASRITAPTTAAMIEPMNPPTLM